MPNIDPDKLLELCHKRRDRNGNVTLSWATMMQIAKQLRQNNTLITRLSRIDADPLLHPHQRWADARAALRKHQDHIADASKMVATEEASHGRG